MQSLSAYGNAGMGLVGAKNDAASAMRDMREGLWKQAYDYRQGRMNKAQSNAAKDRRTQMFSTLLSTAGSLPWADWLAASPQGPFFNQPIDRVPMQQMAPPSYLPPEMRPQRFREGLA